MKYKLNILLAGITAILFIIIEFYCMKLSYFTTGELYSSFLLLVIIFSNLIILTLLTTAFILGRTHKKSPAIKVCAIGLMGLLASFTILPEIYWGNKYLNLKAEGDSLVQYIYTHKEEVGKFPTVIPDKAFSKPGLQDHFDYSFISDEQFTLYYHVKTKQTSHFFRDTTAQNENIGWQYYPD